jgi:hypothetical protein
MTRFPIIIAFLLLLTSVFAFAGDIDLQGHAKGIWSIAGTETSQRWIVIHDLAEGGTTGVYHIEVIKRKLGAPSWQIERLSAHMAITGKALKRSVVKPLKSGAVYPEAFDDGFKKWKAENNGKGGAVCTTSVPECLQK